MDERRELPTTFPLFELIDEMRGIYKSRDDFVHGKRSKGMMGNEEYNLARYSLARIAAVGALLAKLHAEEKAGKVTVPVVEPASDVTAFEDVSERQRMIDAGDDGF